MRSLFSLALPPRTDAALEQTIRRHATAQTVPARQTILEAGDPARGVYYIFSGRVMRSLLNAEGSERILSILPAGWFFGEIESCLNTVSNCYATALEPTELGFIPLETFSGLMKKDGAFNAAILESLAGKALMLSDEVEDLTFSTCKDRLLRLIHANADTAFAFDGKWYQVKRNYTHQEIGTILGVSRVTVSKLLNELCYEGILRMVNRQLQINIRQYNLLSANGFKYAPRGARTKE